MEDFDIIGALKTKAESNGWKFVTAFDSYQRNYGATQEFQNGDIILTVLFSYSFDSGTAVANDIKYPFTLIL